MQDIDELNESKLFEKYSTFSLIKDFKARVIISRLLFLSFLIFLIVLFLPWTQNIQSRGNVTALNPSHRPQNIQSVIGGRIEKWYV
ncbi:MAG: biotin attachment protein, partial [Cyclobacteriaceae bacterium]|nr:biotin attachment protein [Cyclobacteriaceae bacterium]